MRSGVILTLKRCIALLGLFIPLLPVDVSSAQQHYVRPARRKVQYGKSHIPQNTILHNEYTESTTQTDSLVYFTVNYDESDDDGWFVHIDAFSEHPDHTLKRIFTRQRRDVDDDGLLEKRESENALKYKKSSFLHLLTNWWRESNFFDNTSSTINKPNDRHLLENETQVSQLNAFNVSAITEYNVSFGTDSEASHVKNTTAQSNDTSTVIITSSRPVDVNSSNSSDGLDNADNATLASDKKLRYRPLRIRSFLSNEEGGGQHLSNNQRSILLQDIIKPALLSWSAALRVDPVIGNLTVDPDQLVDGTLCGPGGDLPSIVVPTTHTNIGVPDTDFILYVHLAFLPKQSRNSTSSDIAKAENTTTVAEYNSTNDANLDFEIDSQQSNSSDPSSVINSKTLKRQCTGDYLAASSFCSTDQHDRPTAAIIHICIGEDFFDKAFVKANIVVVSHELGHALGFNAVSLAHFRRPNGQPYTDRDPITGEIPLTEINCTGPVGSNRTGRVALPSREILQFRTIRGGVRVAEVVTTSVRQVARNHFDCQKLPGAELESGEFLPLSSYPGEVSCIGDHWERRLFKTDLMNPKIDENVEFTTRFSTITLAYFADSGWYQVDLSRASLSAGWGRAAGCDFIEETCVNAYDGQVPSSFNSFFCNEVPLESTDLGFTSDIHGCTTDLTRKASCSIDRYEGELPPSYQYFNFNYGANVGGADPFMDYCPVYAGFSNGLCSDSENETPIKVSYIERFGQKNSRCLSGRRARVASTNAENGQNSSSTTSYETTALCLPIACVVEDRTLRVQVNGVWLVCTHKDEVLSTSDYSSVETSDTVARVICPDPIRVCPTFYCHRDCLGSSRSCDYNKGKCVCGGLLRANISNTDYDSWDGKRFADVNETDARTCVAPNSSNSFGPSTAESFYEPDEDHDSNGIPASDSPLSDYYYKTERNLREESSTTFWNITWKGIVSGSGTLVFLAMISFLSFYIYGRRFRTILDGVTDDGDNGFDDALSATDEINNPNKDKLMASVVVNLRMNDMNLQRLRREDPLSHRDSETDLSMTDTDGISDIIGTLDVSLEMSSSAFEDGATIVDLAAYDNEGMGANNIGNGLNDEFTNVYVDPLAPPSAQADNKAIVRRRRHLFSRIS